MRKLFVVFLLFLLVGLFIPLVSAVDGEELIFSYTGATSFAAMGHIHPTDESSTSALLDVVSVNGHYFLTTVSSLCYKSGSADAQIRACIMDVNHVSLQNSTGTLSVSTLGTNTAGSVVNWTFAGDLLIQPDTDYLIGFFVESVVLLDGSNTFFAKSSTPAGDGLHMFYTGAWSTDPAQFYLKVYGVAGSEPTPSPSPSPSPSPVPTDRPETTIVSVPSYYMIILVLFAVVAVLAGIYVGFERDGGNKGVAFLFALVALVIFVVLIVGYLVG